MSRNEGFAAASGCYFEVDDRELQLLRKVNG